MSSGGVHLIGVTRTIPSCNLIANRVDYKGI